MFTSIFYFIYNGRISNTILVLEPKALKPRIGLEIVCEWFGQGLVRKKRNHLILLYERIDVQGTHT